MAEVVHLSRRGRGNADAPCRRELLTPVVLFLRGRALALALGGLAAFHVMTYLAIEIHFLAAVVCLLAFVPVERLLVRRRA